MARRQVKGLVSEDVPVKHLRSEEVGRAQLPTVSGCVERRCSPAGLILGKPPYERRDTVGAHLVAASGSRATTRWEIVLISAVAVRRRRVVTMSD